jgi:hypothetical protein
VRRWRAWFEAMILLPMLCGLACQLLIDDRPYSAGADPSLNGDPSGDDRLDELPGAPADGSSPANDDKPAGSTDTRADLDGEGTSREQEGSQPTVLDGMNADPIADRDRAGGSADALDAGGTPDAALSTPPCAGCTIAGQGCVAPGSADPSDVCRLCDPGRSVVAYSLAGGACACAGCFINGSCFDVGPVSPSNPCLVCDPFVARDALTAVEGRVCGDAAGDCFTTSTCDALGACVPRPRLAGSSCGNTISDQCTNPDTCDGSGSCLPNHRQGACSGPMPQCFNYACDDDGQCTGRRLLAPCD